MIVVSDTLIFGMLVGVTLFSAGLIIGWFMGIAREKTDRVRAERDLPVSARPDGKPELVGSR